MGLPGVKPRADRTQVLNRNPVAEWTEVEDFPHEGGPDLPPRTRAGEAAWADAGLVPSEDWPPATRSWWNVIRRMPHACLWSDADWQFAQDTAEVHARFAEGWKGANGSELRQREKLMGVYRDARRDLRIRYVEPKNKQRQPGEEDENVVALDAFRDL